MRLSPAETDRRVAMYRDGCTFAEIGAACGVTGQAVRIHLRSIGEHMPAAWRQRTIPADNRRRALELYEAGYTLPQIKRATGVSTYWLYTHLRRTGTPTRYPRKSAAMTRRWAEQTTGD